MSNKIKPHYIVAIIGGMDLRVLITVIGDVVDYRDKL